MGWNSPCSADFDNQSTVTTGTPLAKQYKNLNVRDTRSQIKTLPNCGVSTINPPKLSIIFVYGAGLTLVKRIESLDDFRVEFRLEGRRFEYFSEKSVEEWAT